MDSFCKSCNDVATCVKKPRLMKLCDVRLAFETYVYLKFESGLFNLRQKSLLDCGKKLKEYSRILMKGVVCKYNEKEIKHEELRRKLGDMCIFLLLLVNRLYQTTNWSLCDKTTSLNDLIELYTDSEVKDKLISAVSKVQNESNFPLYTEKLNRMRLTLLESINTLEREVPRGCFEKLPNLSNLFVLKY